MNFATYEVATGRIVQTGMAGSIEAARATAGPGQDVMVVGGDVRDDTHYVPPGGGTAAFPTRPSPSHVWEWANQRWLDPRTVADHKAQRWAAIKAERERRLAAVGVTSLATFDTATAEARANVTSVAVLLLANPGVPSARFTCADNVRRTFARADFISAASQVGGSAQAIYDTADTLRQQIESATTAEQVLAVVWPA